LLAFAKSWRREYRRPRYLTQLKRYSTKAHSVTAITARPPSQSYGDRVDRYRMCGSHVRRSSETLKPRASGASFSQPLSFRKRSARAQHRRRLKARGPRTFATTSSERDDGFCKMTP